MAMTTANGEYDAAIVGGGPGGAAVATFLQRQGHRCVILERANFPRYHIGESLIPHTFGTLDRLGLLPKLRKSHFPEKHSVRFVSPSGQESDPFYFSETIKGEGSRTWQVERSEFDQICIDHAREAGVEVHMNTFVEEVLFEGDRAVGVRVLTPDGGARDVRARVVVDASGRATIIGNQLKLKGEVPGLNKASLWSYYKGGKRLQGIDAGETTIFTLPGRAWFWYIPLPEDSVSVGLVGDPDHVFRHGDQFEDAFLREVEACAPLMERLRPAKRTSKVHGLRRMSYLNRRTCGDGWVMIGDARAFLDPIYSSGLFLALASAELAAGCIHEGLASGDVSSERLGAFEPALTAGVDVVRRLIHAFYDTTFSFREFVERYPEHRAALIDCLVGDVVKDMSQFTKALEEMTPPPPPLSGKNVGVPV